VDNNAEIDATMINCGQCGKLQVDSLFFTSLPSRLNSSPLYRPRVKYWLGKRRDPSESLIWDEQLFDRIASQPLQPLRSRPTRCFAGSAMRYEKSRERLCT
jgi:hypothetical protein